MKSDKACRFVRKLAFCVENGLRPPSLGLVSARHKIGDRKMQMTTLGRTGIEVSKFCLGSMTWGTQNTTAEGHEQIDAALAAGINFVDTAEMYPVNPLSAETQGRTEEVIGDWFASGGARNRMVLATKHSGNGIAYVREGRDISAASIPEAIDGSLARLKTDYIDLYQFHWPNRGSYMFRKNWAYDPSSQKPCEDDPGYGRLFGRVADGSRPWPHPRLWHEQRKCMGPDTMGQRSGARQRPACSDRAERIFAHVPIGGYGCCRGMSQRRHRDAVVFTFGAVAC